LGEFFTNLCLSGEILDFFLQVSSSPGIRSSLNIRVITDFAVADSVCNLILMLCGTLAQALGFAQQFAGSLTESLSQEAGMRTTTLGHFQWSLLLVIQQSFLCISLTRSQVFHGQLGF
jgi:hypothetical protein